jgi:hypothetical protein
MRIKYLLIFISLVLITFTANQVWAEEKPWSRFALKIGGYTNAVDSQLSLGLKGLDFNFNLEDATGLDVHTTVIRADGFARFTPNGRHRFDLTWYSLHRKGNRTLPEDITIDDVTYPGGTKIYSKFYLDIFKGYYTYSFVQDDRMDLAVGGGLYLMPIDIKIRDDGGLFESQTASLTAPLPVITLRADFAITPKVFLRNSIDVFYLEISGFKGGITNYNIAAEYKFFKYLTAGLGFETFQFQVKNDDGDYPGVDNFVGNIIYRNVGMMLYLKTQF